MALDFAFDKRVARDYASQRAHPPAVSEQIGSCIAEIAGAGATVLELGVGTGRISTPVAAAGLHVIGIDLAREMLQEVEPPHGGPLHLVQGDIQALPFRSSSVDAVLAVHVLHLILQWQETLADVVRVLKPGGRLLQGRDWTAPDSAAGQLRHQLRVAVMELMPNAEPPAARARIPEALVALGGEAGPQLVAASWTDHPSPASIMRGMAARADAETWALPEALLQAAVAQVRAWASAQWEDLDSAQPVERRFLINVTRF